MYCDVIKLEIVLLTKVCDDKLTDLKQGRKSPQKLCFILQCYNKMLLMWHLLLQNRVIKYQESLENMWHTLLPLEPSFVLLTYVDVAVGYHLFKLIPPAGTRNWNMSASLVCYSSAGLSCVCVECQRYICLIHTLFTNEQGFPSFWVELLAQLFS